MTTFIIAELFQWEFHDSIGKPKIIPLGITKWIHWKSRKDSISIPRRIQFQISKESNLKSQKISLRTPDGILQEFQNLLKFRMESFLDSHWNPRRIQFGIWGILLGSKKNLRKLHLKSQNKSIWNPKIQNPKWFHWKSQNDSSENHKMVSLGITKLFHWESQNNP